MFLLLNPLGQAVVTVTVEYRHCCLNQDRTGIQVLCNQVNRATSESDPGLEGLADAIKPPEAGQQRWMDVCLLYTSPSPRDGLLSRMPSSA